MEEGKKRSQIKDSETFAFIAMLGIAIMLLIMALSSCKTSKAQGEDDEDAVYINIDGHQVELVADEYGGQYLKQYVGDGYIIYIPYPGETEETDSLHFYNAKNK